MNTTGTPTEPCSALANAANLRSSAESDNDRGSSPNMPEDYQSPPPTPSPILTRAEVARRIALLADLQAELAARGVCSVLARTWRLVLRYNTGPWEPSGPTDSQLRILGPDGTDMATTERPSLLLCERPAVRGRRSGQRRRGQGGPRLTRRGGRSRYVQLHCHVCQGI